MNPQALMSILQGPGPGSGGNLPFPTPGLAPPAPPSGDALASAIMPPMVNQELPPLPKKKKLSAIAQLVAAHFAKQAPKPRQAQQQPMGNTNGASY